MSGRMFPIIHSTYTYTKPSFFGLIEGRMRVFDKDNPEAGLIFRKMGRFDVRHSLPITALDIIRFSVLIYHEI